jgi:hypothetical protein
MGKPYSHADHRRKRLTDQLDDGATLLYSAIDGEIVVTLRINWGEDSAALEAFAESCALVNFKDFPATSISFCSRLMIHQSHRYTSLAIALSSAAYVIGRERSTQFNFVHCAPRIVRFFERMGFRRYTNHFYDLEIGPQVPLVLVLEDVEHLRALNSPFLAHAVERASHNHSVSWFLKHFSNYQPVNPTSMEATARYESDQV